MKHSSLFATAIVGCVISVAYAEDTPQPPRTHVDTTVVGSAASADSNNGPAATLDNDHHFEAGAPDLVKITNKLQLSAQQQAQLNDAVERADAGAAVLIKREHDLNEMIAATTPADPLYTKLIADQAASSSRWTENRDGLRRDIIAILNPAQRTRFEALQASR
jgi:hypothetical protein